MVWQSFAADAKIISRQIGGRENLAPRLKSGNTAALTAKDTAAADIPPQPAP